MYAEENAIDDTIYYLSEALRKGVIPVDVYLKVWSILKYCVCVSIYGVCDQCVGRYICGCDRSLVMVQTGVCSFSSATFVMVTLLITARSRDLP